MEIARPIALVHGLAAADSPRKNMFFRAERFAEQRIAKGMTGRKALCAGEGGAVNA